MSAPVPNRRLTLEAPERVPDGAGGFAVTWVALGVLWAAVAPGPGRAAAGAGAAVGRATSTITLRAAPPGSPTRPAPDQRFRAGARVLTILSVAESTDGRWLTCTATEEVAR